MLAIRKRYLDKKRIIYGGVAAVACMGMLLSIIVQGDSLHEPLMAVGNAKTEGAETTEPPIEEAPVSDADGGQAPLANSGSSPRASIATPMPDNRTESPVISPSASPQPSAEPIPTGTPTPTPSDSPAPPDDEPIQTEPDNQ